MSTIDHASEAGRLAKEAITYADFRNPANVELQLAQVHATLALVEQTRIGNLIAYWQLHTPRDVEGSLGGEQIEVGQILDDEERGVDDQVRAGLGLA